MSCMRDVPSNVVTDNAHKWFKIALIVHAGHGLLHARRRCDEVLSQPFYWVKMTALAIGIVFVFAIRRPLLQARSRTDSSDDAEAGGACVDVVWFIVAASGRWIGFS